MALPGEYHSNLSFLCPSFDDSFKLEALSLRRLRGIKQGQRPAAQSNGIRSQFHTYSRLNLLYKF